MVSSLTKPGHPPLKDGQEDVTVSTRTYSWASMVGRHWLFQTDQSISGMERNYIGNPTSSFVEYIYLLLVSERLSVLLVPVSSFCRCIYLLRGSNLNSRNARKKDPHMQPRISLKAPNPINFLEGKGLQRGHSVQSSRPQSMPGQSAVT